MAETREEMIARLEAERNGPPIREFGPVDGPQKRQMAIEAAERVADEIETAEKVRQMRPATDKEIEAAIANRRRSRLAREAKKASG